MTGFVPIMWALWGVCVLLLIGLNLYRSSLTRDEEDQIFLDESFAHEKNAQAAIVSRVGKIEPLVRVALGLAVTMTVVVLVYYALDIVRQFK